MLRRTFVQTVGSSVLLGSGVHLRPSENPPNILWLMTDEQRTDSLGCYGSPWAATPNLDRLANEGVLFENAITSAPVCGPARASLTTGLYPHQTGVWWNIRKKKKPLPHLTEIFHRAGYVSASFGKQHYCSPNKAFQLTKNLVISDAVSYFAYASQYNASDFDVVQYPPKPYPWILGGRFPEPASETAEARVVEEAWSWLSGLEEGTPFFLRLSFNMPHTPVAVPEPFDECIDPEDIQLPAQAEPPPPHEPKWISESLRQAADSSRLTADQIRKMRRYYYGQVSFVDSLFGSFLRRMEKAGLLENTIVVFVSDHGTHLGDYGLVQKQTFYEPVVRVPYFFWFPKKLSGGRILQTPVETRTLMPTLLHLAGLPFPERLTDANLAESLIHGKEPPAHPVFSEFTLGSFEMRPDDRLVLVRHGKWKLSVCPDSPEGDSALYDLQTDPFERRNLAEEPAFADVRNELEDLIVKHLGS